jgi:hypothetical protein
MLPFSASTTQMRKFVDSKNNERAETCIKKPRKIQILRLKIREFKIPVERKLLTFVRTNKGSAQEFGKHPNAKAFSARKTTQ